MSIVVLISRSQVIWSVIMSHNW